MSLIIYVLIATVVLYHLRKFMRFKTVDLRGAFKDKVFFLTGGSSGIGEALTKELVKLGARKVVIASRNEQEMERVR
jgi:FlaA1/EpsC-like NDP-sugar epimerase